MAQVLTNFLVGLGFQYDSKGAKEIDAGIQSIKASALQLGAVVGGAFGMKALTSDFAASTNTLTDFARVMGTGAEEVLALGTALRTEGGTLESFMSQIAGIERLRAGLLVGDAGFIAQAGRAGIDTGPLIAATNATEAYISLADQFARMTTQQRLNAAAALGLDEASIRLLSQGSAQVDALVAKFRDIRPLTGEMSQAARDFRNEWVELEGNIGGVADAISTQLLPVINDITGQINSWFGENRGDVRTGIRGFIAEGQDRLNEAGGLSLGDFTFWGNLKNLSDILRESSTGQQWQADWFGQFSAPASPMFQVAPGSPGSFQPAPFAAGTGATAPQPIRITNEVILDGRVIDRRIQDVVGEMGTTTIDELSTNTKG